jgi:uncharacterized membrane protein YqiK
MAELIHLLAPIAIILVAFMAMGMIFARLYQRASKEVSFVRTGLGGQLVVMNGGALVFPVLHETISVNMNTLRLEVRRAQEQALITRDRMRVDVLAEFYVRVQPTAARPQDVAAPGLERACRGQVRRCPSRRGRRDDHGGAAREASRFRAEGPACGL